LIIDLGNVITIWPFIWTHLIRISFIWICNLTSFIRISMWIIPISCPIRIRNSMVDLVYLTIVRCILVDVILGLQFTSIVSMSYLLIMIVEVSLMSILFFPNVIHLFVVLLDFFESWISLKFIKNMRWCFLSFFNFILFFNPVKLLWIIIKFELRLRMLFINFFL